MKNNQNTKYLRYLEYLATKKNTTRRGFMQGAIASGLTVSAATMLWTSAVEAATPRRGGKFSAGVHDANVADSLDPAVTSSIYMIQVSHSTRNYLTEMTADSEVVPELAESWEASPDARRWSFKVRKGVEFHNGKTLTPQDVVDSLNYHRGADSSSAAKDQLSVIEDIKADGDNVIISAKIGFADMPYMLTDYHLVILPSNGDGTIDWQSGVGTGAYKINRHEPGIGTEMTRNSNFFKPNRGWFEEVEFLALNDTTARTTSLRSGEIDAATNLDLRTVDLLDSDPNIEIDNIPSGAHATLPMFTDVAPFDDLNVRLALKYGFPRQQVIDTIRKGYATIGNDHPIGPTIPYHAELEQRHYDPDKASFHLKKAGLEKLTVKLSAADVMFQGAVDTAVIFSEAAKKAGIEIEVVREPNDGYWSDVWMVKPFVIAQWGQRPTPDVLFSLGYQGGATWNESRWNNERFNELLILAKGELNQERRSEMYREMQLLCRDDGGTIIPFFANRVDGRRKHIQHSGKVSGVWELDGARAAERWWRV